MTAEQRNIVSPLQIEGEMTIYRAVELKHALMDPLRNGGILEADLSGVTEIDTTGLQLLMLAKKTAQERGGELRLVGHSAAVIDVLELLDVADWFADPLELPATGT